jgi:hypothetical protein
MAVMIFGIGLLRLILQVPLLGLLVVPGILLLECLYASWCMRVLEESQAGVDRVPRGPSFNDLPGLFTDAFLASYGPALVLQGAAGNEPWSLPLLGLCNVLGAVYHPMAILLIVFMNFPSAPFRYPFGLRSILRDYLLCTILFQATRHLASLGIFLGTGGSLPGNFGQIPRELWFVLYRAGVTVEGVCAASQMRALGLPVRAHPESLGWFRTHHIPGSVEPR